MHRTNKFSEDNSIIWPVCLNGWLFVYKLSGCGFDSYCSHLNFRCRTCLKQGEFLEIQATVDCGFTLKCLREMIIT